MCFVCWRQQPLLGLLMSRVSRVASVLGNILGTCICHEPCVLVRKEWYGAWCFHRAQLCSLCSSWCMIELVL
jgi:hypothetical protein